MAAAAAGSGEPPPGAEGRGADAVQPAAAGHSSCSSPTSPVAKSFSRGFSIEEIVSKCRGRCPTAKMEALMRQQINVLRDELHQLQHESAEDRRIRLALEAELFALRDTRTWLQCWYRHRNGRLKKRWLTSATLVGGIAMYYWYHAERATTPMGRCLLQLVERVRAWRDHAAAVSDDMTVMGPFIHHAAETVRLIYANELFNRGRPWMGGK